MLDRTSFLSRQMNTNRPNSGVGQGASQVMCTSVSCRNALPLSLLLCQWCHIPYLLNGSFLSHLPLPCMLVFVIPFLCCPVIATPFSLLYVLPYVRSFSISHLYAVLSPCHLLDDFSLSSRFLSAEIAPNANSLDCRPMQQRAVVQRPHEFTMLVKCAHDITNSCFVSFSSKEEAA